MTKHLTLALLLATVACGSSAPPPPPPAQAGAAQPDPLSPAQRKLATSLDQAATAALDGVPMAGVSVAVVQDGHTLLARGYGRADVSAGTPAAAETIYEIGSITKSFTASLIVKLAAAGKLSIDDPITRFLPDYDTHGATITLRHLLTHTSGIKGYTEIPAVMARIGESFPRSELVAMIAAEPLQFQPGTKWAYSNSGYYLLGLVIEKVTGKPYADAVHDLVAPLGLADTGYCPPHMTGPRDARPYEIANGKPVPAEPLDMAHPYAAGALCSTAPDLARWIAALADGTAVTADQWRQMTTPLTLNDGSHFPYGFGLMSGAIEGHPSIGHNGGINGFHSKMVLYPDDHLVVVALANTGGGVVEKLTEALARTALDLPAPTVADLPLSAEQATAYQGRYRFAEVGISVAFRYQGGALEVANLDDKGEPQRWLQLHYQGNHVFLAPEVHARVTFAVDGGRATAVQLEQGGIVLSGQPLP